MMEVPREVAEWAKTTSSILIGLLACYTALRLAVSKAQIARVRWEPEPAPGNIAILNAGETVFFVARIGIVGKWGKPFFLLDGAADYRVEPGQRIREPIVQRTDYLPEVVIGSHVWAELHSGVRITSHRLLDPRKWLVKWRRPVLAVKR